MMDSGQIRKVIAWLQEKVGIDKVSGAIKIAFAVPVEDDFIAGGFSIEMIEQTLKADWWPEMVADILETPQFAEPDDPPEKVLGYARDVVHEYIGKRIL
jgi:hypothetical protein